LSSFADPLELSKLLRNIKSYNISTINAGLKPLFGVSGYPSGLQTTRVSPM
jgi:hypothetical protein